VKEVSLSPYELALIAGGFTILGALIGGWFGYRNALKIYSITEFNKAASRFRSAFLSETTFLKHNANIGGLGQSHYLHEKLRSGYLRHLKALELFKNHLPVADRHAIDHVWDEYCYPDGIPLDPDEKRDFRFNGYMSIEDTEGTERAKAIALDKIHKLLGFANAK
jgi:hypothetical protein